MQWWGKKNRQINDNLLFNIIIRNILRQITRFYNLSEPKIPMIIIKHDIQRSDPFIIIWNAISGSYNKQVIFMLTISA